MAVICDIKQGYETRMKNESLMYDNHYTFSHDKHVPKNYNKDMKRLLLDTDRVAEINRILGEADILFLSKDDDNFQFKSMDEVYGLENGSLVLTYSGHAIKFNFDPETTRNNSNHRTEKVNEFLNREDIQKIIHPPITKNELSFDELILKCDEMLDIESMVTDRFNAWVAKNSSKSGIKSTKTSFIYFLSVLLRSVFLHPACFFWPFYDVKWNGTLKKLINKQAIDKIINQTIMIGKTEIWASNYPYSYGNRYGDGVKSGLPSIMTRIKLHDLIKKHKKGVKPRKKEEVTIDLSEYSEEEVKLIFLKESFVGTIQNLNSKLEQVKSIISKQISKHQRDKEDILRHEKMFKNSSEIISKIDEKVADLDKSYGKIIEKKASLNAALDEYIGADGYIAQKEKEIADLKIAQELSSRMEKNFQKTLEIINNVDVLTDTIIPGIKMLMSYKIPELLDKIDFETDKETVLLHEKASMIA